MNFLPGTEKLAKQVSVKSAVNPSLWACVVISLPLFVLSVKSIGWVSVAFFIVGLFPILAFFFSYIYLLFKNPNYLRSEEYQLRAEALKCFGDKDNPMNATPEHIITVVTNPQLPAPNKNQSENYEQLSSANSDE